MEALKVILPIYFVLFALWGFRNMKMFFLLTGIVTMPFRTTYTIMDIGAYIGWTNGINIALSDISFICLFLYLVLTGRKLQGFSRKLIVPTLFFVGASILSLANSTWIRLSLFESFMILQVFFLYYIVLSSAIESERELHLVVAILMISLIVQGSFSIFQYVTGRAFDPFATGTPITEADEEGGVTRAIGTIGKPNGLAMYLVPLLLLVSSILMRAGAPFRKLGIIAVSTGGLALLFSFSRGGWMAFIVAFLALLIAFSKGRYVRSRTPFVALFIGILVVLAFYPQIHGRLVSEAGGEAAMDRIPLIKIAWNMIKDNPILGVGANTFMSVVDKYMRGPDLRYIYVHLVHNQYLLVFAETGLVGMCMFLWMLFACFRESTQCARSSTSDFGRTIGISVTAGFIAMAVHMMVDMYSSPLCLGLLFVFCALCSAARKIQGEVATPAHA